MRVYDAIGVGPTQAVARVRRYRDAEPRSSYERLRVSGRAKFSSGARPNPLLVRYSYYEREDDATESGKSLSRPVVYQRARDQLVELLERRALGLVDASQRAAVRKIALGVERGDQRLAVVAELPQLPFALFAE